MVVPTLVGGFVERQIVAVVLGSKGIRCEVTLVATISRVANSILV